MQKTVTSAHAASKRQSRLPREGIGLDRIKQNAFVIIGRAGLDLFTDAGVVIEDAAQLTVDLGGSAANMGVGLCKLGSKAALVTRVSDDAVGRYCVKRLGHYGVDATHVTPVGGEFRNSLAVYETVNKNQRNVIYRNGAADFEMSVADVQAVDFSAYGALVTAGTVFAAEPSRSATFHAFDLARKAGVPVVFDVDYRPYSWPSAQEAADVLSRAARQSDIIVGNDEEFGFMAGDYTRGLETARHLSQDGAAIVVYKMGGAGAITFTNGQEFRTGIYKVDALKPTGAGDSFMAGFLSGLAAGADVAASVRRGAACAAITVSHPGCAPAMPDTDALAAFVASHPGVSAI